MLFCLITVIHVDKDHSSEFYEFSLVVISLNLREFHTRCVHHMLLHEVSLVTVEAIGNEYGHIVHPCVTGCGA